MRYHTQPNESITTRRMTMFLPNGINRLIRTSGVGNFTLVIMFILHTRRTTGVSLHPTQGNPCITKDIMPHFQRCQLMMLRHLISRLQGLQMNFPRSRPTMIQGIRLPRHFSRRHVTLSSTYYPAMRHFILTTTRGNYLLKLQPPSSRPIFVRFHYRPTPPPTTHPHPTTPSTPPKPHSNHHLHPSTPIPRPFLLLSTVPPSP